MAIFTNLNNSFLTVQTADDTKLGREKPLGENHSIWLLTTYVLHTVTGRSAVNKSEHSSLFTL